MIGPGGLSCNLGRNAPRGLDPDPERSAIPAGRGPWVGGGTSVECPGMDRTFSKISPGEIPTNFVLEDESVVVPRESLPQAPSHLQVVPREPVALLRELEDRDLAGSQLSAPALAARDAGLESGRGLIANSRDHGGQEVPHLHVQGSRPLGPVPRQGTGATFEGK